MRTYTAGIRYIACTNQTYEVRSTAGNKIEKITEGRPVNIYQERVPGTRFSGLETITNIHRVLSRTAVSYTNLRAHETRGKLVCRLLLEKKNIYICITQKKTVKEKVYSYNERNCERKKMNESKKGKHAKNTPSMRQNR